MCDRSKQEILARELCLNYWRGKESEGAKRTNYTNTKDYVESNWHAWKKMAEQILQILEEHK